MVVSKNRTRGEPDGRKSCRAFLRPERGERMPRKPKHPCGYPGCPELTDGRYCEKHARVMNKRYEKYGRNPEAKKRYGRAWKRIRDRYAAQHPLCEQ